MRSRSRCTRWKSARGRFVEKPEYAAVRTHARGGEGIVALLYAQHHLSLLSAGYKEGGRPAGVDCRVGEGDARFRRPVHRQHPSCVLRKGSSTGKQRSRVSVFTHAQQHEIEERFLRQEDI